LFNDELLFGIGACLQICAVLTFLPLIPSISALFFHYSRAAHFLIISDFRFILTIAFGIVGILLIILPSLDNEVKV
jgi:hypothetical protein